MADDAHISVWGALDALGEFLWKIVDSVREGAQWLGAKENPQLVFAIAVMVTMLAAGALAWAKSFKANSLRLAVDLAEKKKRLRRAKHKAYAIPFFSLYRIVLTLIFLGLLYFALHYALSLNERGVYQERIP